MRCSMTAIGRGLVVLALGPCLLALAGCGKGGSTLGSGPTGSVTGKVTLKGQAVPAGSTITFIHQEKSFPATATIAADGTYTLLFNNKPAIPVGTYKVSITPPAGTEGPAPDPSNPEAYKAVMMTGKGAASGAAKQSAAVPAKYKSPDSSGLTCTVSEGPPTSFDVDMTDK